MTGRSSAPCASRGIEELGQLWDEGLASGPGKLGDMGSIKAEARRHHQAALDETK